MEFDAVVIGSGPGGYIGAIRMAQLGLKVAIIEKYPSLGGTCLNVGCIPSKALLDSTERFFEVKRHGAEHGIVFSEIKVSFEQMMKRKEEVVRQITQGVSLLMKKHKIGVFNGVGSLAGAGKVKLKKVDGTEEIFSARNILIATGSKPSGIPGVLIDKERIISSTEALVLREIPRRMIVIGAGAIGMELASVYARIGTEVVVVEYLDSALPMMDIDLGRELTRVLKKELNLNVMVSHKVEKVEAMGKGVRVRAIDKKGKETQLEGDYCIVAVGRRPYVEGLGLENIGIKPDEKGRIPVNENLETSAKGVFAIGDVVRGAMLAHKAEEEGIFVAETIAGQKPHIDYLTIPGVVYTWPEVASVGYTEPELKNKGVTFKKGKAFFRASGRAKASGDIDGFIKVLADEKTDEILGVHMIGPRVADLIAEAVVAMGYKAAAEDIARCCHPHPTYSETFREACLSVTSDRALNA